MSSPDIARPPALALPLHYRIGPADAALSFPDRLARQNGWLSTHAERVLEEYRRFAFVAATAGYEVTPSDAVGQAWHLHLTYKRDYWDRFCPLLGCPLHHGPGVGTLRDKPVGHLTGLLIVTAVMALIRFAVVNRRTRAGNRALEAARADADRLRRAPTPGEIDLAVALFGTVVLAGSPWVAFHQLRTSGDGGPGSDGGGGCGGCGG